MIDTHVDQINCGLEPDIETRPNVRIVRAYEDDLTTTRMLNSGADMAYIQLMLRRKSTKYTKRQ
jgi:hypothetical protein